MGRDEPMKPEWFMYVVRCSDGTLYTGITTDVTRRLDEHNGSKKGAKYTRARRPVELVYWIDYSDRSTASKAEAKFKKLSRKEKLRIISGELSDDNLEKVIGGQSREAFERWWCDMMNSRGINKLD
jgi:putative endonuclease